MCTAYELGKRGGSFPDQVKARAMKELSALVVLAARKCSRNLLLAGGP